MIESYHLWARLVSWAVLLQTIEYILMKKSLIQGEIWNWQQIKKDYDFFPTKLLVVLTFINKPNHFLELLILRFFLSLLGLFFPSIGLLFLILFFITFLMTLRFRGNFNGGSDYLTLISLLCLFVGSLHPSLMKASLFYMALQIISSYFLAGLFKIKSHKWRNGEALLLFIKSSSYRSPEWSRKLLKINHLPLFGAWGVLLFECTYPLLLLHPGFTSVYLSLGIVFHFINFLIFGLNRFFWIWTACYPTVYYLCQHFQKII